MKTYKFSTDETATILSALISACNAAKKELEDDIKLDLQMSCKSIVESDKKKYEALCKLKEIVWRHGEIKIEGD